MYNEILVEYCTHSGVTRPLQLLVLQWVTHCSRPLRVLELATILKFVPYFTELVDLQAAKNAARTCCGPLLEILEDETVQVIHHSLTEFLLNAEGNRPSQELYADCTFPSIVPSQAHPMIASTCIDYLCSRSTDLSADGEIRSREKDLKTQLHRFPFLQYASRNWPLHVSSSNGLENRLFIKLDAFLREGNHAFEWWKAFWLWPSKSSSLPGGFSPLHVVAYNGILVVLQHVLNSGIDPNMKDEDGRTPISYASVQGHSDVVSLLLDYNGLATTVDKLGLTPLHHAARANHAKVIHTLIAAGADPLTPATEECATLRMIKYSRNSSLVQETPLFYACRLGNLHAASMLLQSIDPADIPGGLLHAAAQEGRAKMVTLLLQYKPIVASINDIDKHGNTALYVAAHVQHPAMIRTLLVSGADINAKSEGVHPEYHITRVNRRKRACTPLHGWAMGPRDRLYRQMNEKELEASAKLLIDGGCDVDATDGEGRIALLLCSNLNHAPQRGNLIRILLSHGVNPSTADKDGNTSLHYVLGGNDQTQFGLLVEYGADINVVGKDGRTPPLALAAVLGPPPILHLEIFKKLNADFDRADDDGNTVLHLACRSPFVKASDLAKFLTITGTNPCIPNKLGETCLFSLACIHCDEIIDSISLLTQNGVDLETRNYLGQTVLLHAVSNGSKEFVRGLLKHGADVTAKDFQGKTGMKKSFEPYR